jgi:hypothetical protein
MAHKSKAKAVTPQKDAVVPEGESPTSERPGEGEQEEGNSQSCPVVGFGASAVGFRI